MVQSLAAPKGFGKSVHGGTGEVSVSTARALVTTARSIVKCNCADTGAPRLSRWARSVRFGEQRGSVGLTPSRLRRRETRFELEGDVTQLDTVSF